MSEEKKKKSGYAILRAKLNDMEKEKERLIQDNADLVAQIEALKAKKKDVDWKKSFDSLNECYEEYRTFIQKKISNLGFLGKILWNRA